MRESQPSGLPRRRGPLEPGLGPRIASVDDRRKLGTQGFEIGRRLREDLDVPVSHDDQHETAGVVASGG